MGDVVADISAWLLSQGLADISQEQLLEGYCTRLVDAGVSVARIHVALRALHPVFGGLGFDWYRNGKSIVRQNYTRESVPRLQWVNSPFYDMLKKGLMEFRAPLTGRPDEQRFPILADLHTQGFTDYFAAAKGFTQELGSKSSDPNDPPEGMIISWTSDAEGGFSDREIAILRQLMPPLALALKSASNRQTGRDLLATYLGPDAGARVLSGDIQRGSLETIRAVIWYFDLQGFTTLAETNPGPAVIAMLNDYFGAVVSVIRENRGQVMKFMGDGLLAIFAFAEQQEACHAAIAAAARLRNVMHDLSRQREQGGLPHTGFTLSLHAGDVLYGNIGAEDRLDFTVIGPAVNAAARILDMCKPLGQDLVFSAQAARPALADRDDLISLGRYMLRGIPEPQELFTLAP